MGERNTETRLECYLHRESTSTYRDEHSEIAIHDEKNEIPKSSKERNEDEVRISEENPNWETLDQRLKSPPKFGKPVWKEKGALSLCERSAQLASNSKKRKQKRRTGLGRKRRTQSL